MHVKAGPFGEHSKFFRLRPCPVRGRGRAETDVKLLKLFTDTA
jgi:hypothetical protein